MTRAAIILLAAIPLAVAWHGCASQKATLVPKSEKEPSFSQRYEMAKYLISSGQLDKATKQLKKLERNAGSDAERGMASEAKASLHLARHEFILAEDDASKAIVAFPSLASAYGVRAFARKGQGNLSGAVQDFRSRLALEPNDAESLRGLAGILGDQNKTLESVRVLERLLQVDSLDTQVQEEWCGSMASLLGLDSFPVQYLRALRSNSLVRGELAAVLVVESELARRELEEGQREVESSSESRGASAQAGRSSYYQERTVNRALANLPDCEQFWFAPFAEKAVSLGLLSVYPDGTFRPQDAVRKGILTLDLYTFLSRRCANAMTEAGGKLGYTSESNEGNLAQRLDSESARVSEYSDVDDSSYLWRPVMALIALEILKPASPSPGSFGINNPLRGEEVTEIARNLTSTLARAGCKLED